MATRIPWSAVTWMEETGAAEAWATMVPDAARREDNQALWQELFFGGGPPGTRDLIEFALPGQPAGPVPVEALGQVLPAKHAIAVEALDSEADPVERCVFCKLAFGKTVQIGPNVERVERNARNPMYCNSCDWLIRTYPGYAFGPAVVLALDMKGSSPDRVLDPAAHREKLLDWKHRIVPEIHRHWGFMHSSIADHAIAVWFPGFLPSDQRKSEGALVVSARHAFEAAHAIIALNVPVEFRLGLDAAEGMNVYANQLVSNVPLGPVLVDMAGEAIEVAVDIAENKTGRDPSARYVATSRFLDLAGVEGEAHYGPVSRHGIDAWTIH